MMRKFVIGVLVVSGSLLTQTCSRSKPAIDTESTGGANKSRSSPSPPPSQRGSVLDTDKTGGIQSPGPTGPVTPTPSPRRH